MSGAHSVRVPVVFSLKTPDALLSCHFPTALSPSPFLPPGLEPTRMRPHAKHPQHTALSAERPCEGASGYDDCGLQMTKLRHTDAETKAHGDARNPLRWLEFRSPQFNPKQHHHACYSFCEYFSRTAFLQF